MTNETLETIKSRRSCRAYKPEQITNEELDAVLEAGTYAASAMGRQSAKIVVVQDAGSTAQRKSLKQKRARPCSGSGASRAIGSASATAFWATLLQTPSPQHPASRIIS